MTLGLSGPYHTLKQKEGHCPGGHHCPGGVRSVQSHCVVRREDPVGSGIPDGHARICLRRYRTSAENGYLAKEEYERLNPVADEARLKAEHARIALKQHAAAHRC